MHILFFYSFSMIKIERWRIFRGALTEVRRSLFAEILLPYWQMTCDLLTDFDFLEELLWISTQSWSRCYTGKLGGYDLLTLCSEGGGYRLGNSQSPLSRFIAPPRDTVS